MISNNIKIESLLSDDIECVHHLYSSIFGEKQWRYWKTRFQWQFIENPSASALPSLFWIATRDRCVLGFLASFPVRMKIGDNVESILLPCDLMVSPEARGQRLSNRLLEEFIKVCGATAIALAYTPGIEKIYDRLGFHRVYIEPYYMRPLNWSKTLFEYYYCPERHHHYKIFVSLASHSAGTILGGISWFLNNYVKNPKLSGKYVVNSIVMPDSSFDKLWKEISPHIPILTVRDSTFVKWRFLMDPLSNHTLLLCRSLDGQPVGYLAYRTTKKKGIEIGQIMDIFCHPHMTDVVDELFKTCCQNMKKINVSIIICKGINPSIRTRIKKYMYINLPGRNLPAMIFNKGDLASKKFLCNPENWHVGHADGDEDFSP